MYQIIEFNDASGKWAFVAHGARYSKEDATNYTKRAETRGVKYILLPVPASV